MPRRRYTAEEKMRILETIGQAHTRCPDLSLSEIFADLGLGSTTYYRWRQRAAQARLSDEVRLPERQAVPPTPGEIAVTAGYARQHPLLGYKRLAYALMAENQAFLRPWMVHDILAEAQLLGRRAPEPEPLVRPPAADHPDQR